jgi:hypothetical protein
MATRISCPFPGLGSQKALGAWRVLQELLKSPSWRPGIHLTGIEATLQIPPEEKDAPRFMLQMELC